MFVEIPEPLCALVIEIVATVVPDVPPINCLSISRDSLVYADQPSVMLTTPTCPPEITTDALAPFQVKVPELKSFMP